MHWHGKLGTVIYALGLVALLTGVQDYLEESKQHLSLLPTLVTYHYPLGTEHQNLAVTIYALGVVMAFFVMLFESIVKGGDLVPKPNPKIAKEEEESVDEIHLEEQPAPFPMTDSPRAHQPWAKM